MSDDRFVPETEAYTAAVWYVMREALASYEKNKEDIARGRRSKWVFLNRIRRVLVLEPRHVNYVQMRAELEDFALNFGVAGQHEDCVRALTSSDTVSTKTQITKANQQAMKEFSE